MQQMTLCQSTATLASGTFFSRHIGRSLLSSRGAFLFVVGVVAVFVLALFSRVGWACLSGLNTLPLLQRVAVPVLLAWGLAAGVLELSVSEVPQSTESSEEDSAATSSLLFWAGLGPRTRAPCFWSFACSFFEGALPRASLVGSLS